MNWKHFDFLRRDVGPIELDLVEAYGKSRITRRDFVKRGTMIGLSVPFMASVIAACGSDSEGASTEAGDEEETGSDDSGAATVGGSMVLANQQGDANSGLDPIAMLDLGTYNVVSQSFEYLVGISEDGNLGPTGLATAWSTNEDGTVWTFELREGVTWHSGGEFTSADVAATMDRLVAAGNAGLAGIIEEGSVDSSDPAVAVFTLPEPNGNFPALVSTYNAQTVITPTDYSNGTTLDERQDGTGAWILDSFDPTSFTAKFTRNPDWWGGSTPLDAIELRGFADIGTAVTAMTSGEVDALSQFETVGGEGLLAAENFVVLTPPSTGHRQVWFNTQEGGPYEDKLVRRALAYTLDRDQINQTLFNGKAVIGNDHPIHPTLPFFDSGAVPQRSRDIEMAKSLLAEAGQEAVASTFEAGDIVLSGDLAGIIKQNSAEAGFDLTVNVQSNSTFYGDAWCPGPSETDDSLPCAGSAGVGVVDWGHRPVPDVFLNSALTTGAVWNGSNYASEEYDAAFNEYSTSLDVDSQKAASSKIMQILHEDTPALYPFFIPYLAGHSDAVSGMVQSALGQTILSGASKEG